MPLWVHTVTCGLLVLHQGKCGLLEVVIAFDLMGATRNRFEPIAPRPHSSSKHFAECRSFEVCIAISRGVQLADVMEAVCAAADGRHQCMHCIHNVAVSCAASRLGKGIEARNLAIKLCQFLCLPRPHDMLHRVAQRLLRTPSRERTCVQRTSAHDKVRRA